MHQMTPDNGRLNDIAAVILFRDQMAMVCIEQQAAAGQFRVVGSGVVFIHAGATSGMGGKADLLFPNKDAQAELLRRLNANPEAAFVVEFDAHGSPIAEHPIHTSPGLNP